MFAVVALAVLDGVLLLLVRGLGRAGEDLVVGVDLSEYEDDDRGAGGTWRELPETLATGQSNCALPLTGM
jgi:hypothetical protein